MLISCLADETARERVQLAETDFPRERHLFTNWNAIRHFLQMFLTCKQSVKKLHNQIFYISSSFWRTFKKLEVVVV